MSELVFIKKYQNKIFDGFLINSDAKVKHGTPIHLIITPNYFDIYNDVWDKRLKRVTCDKFGKAYVKDDCIIIEVKNDKDPMKIQPKKNAQELAEALTLAPSNSTQFDPKETLAYTKVLPSINLGTIRSTADLYSDLKNISAEFLNILTPSVSKTSTGLNTATAGGSTQVEQPQSAASRINLCFVDLLICIYQVRFGNRKPASTTEINNNIGILYKELRLTFLKIWVDSLEHASRLQINKDFLVRLISALGNSIALMIEFRSDVNLEQLLGACAYYCDGGNIAGVYHECKKAADAIANAKAALRAVADSSTLSSGDKSANRFSAPCEMPEYADKLYSIAIMLMAGKLTEIYQFDFDSLTEETVNIVTVTGAQSTPKPQQMDKLDLQMKSFSGDMLRKFKDRRYEPLFQYVFAMWVLREPISDSTQ